jgi:hypothetical protein
MIAACSMSRFEDNDRDHSLLFIICLCGITGILLVQLQFYGMFETYEFSWGFSKIS